MRRTKGISYDVENDQYLVDHIEKQPNQSRYVLDLVKVDMENIQQSEDERLKSLIEQILKDKGIR